LENVRGSFFQRLSAYRGAISRWLRTHPVEAVWVHGWGHPYNLASLLEVFHSGAKVLMQAETHLDCLRGSMFRKILHRMVFGTLFRKIDGFLAIGSANHKFYRSYGVPEKKIHRMPYVVDNDFFQTGCRAAAAHTSSLKSELNLAQERPVVLFCGKLIPAKSVDVLIRALHHAASHLAPAMRPQLVVVGEGELKGELLRLCDTLLPGDARFVGFRNQSELPSYYTLADIFVLPSKFEPWGLVVNEAMNAGKPVVTSDVVGSRWDLVMSGSNGGVFRAGDPESLAKVLLPLLLNPGLRAAEGELSLRRIGQWGFPQAIAGLRRGMEALEKAAPSRQLVLQH
jgi:glycosyltransferase involved in cell wall biosynthesis